MYSSLRLSPFLLTGCLVLCADDPSWVRKPIQAWSAEDANQVLTDSPWAAKVAPQWVRDLSPDERRMGGDLEADRGKGVGLEGLIGIFDSQREAEAVAKAHAKPDPGTVLVRWESAAPLRAAAQKAAVPPLPLIDYDRFYVIAVYNIQTPNRWNLEHELRGIAALKRDKKKDLKPSRVMILRDTGDEATLIYLFPRSAEIGKRDGNITFQAQVGSLVVTRVFSTDQMQIAGRLEI